MTLPVGTKIPLFAEGNANVSDVLEGVTFSTSSGSNLVGTMKKKYNNIFEPKKEDVYGDIGYYEKGVHVLPITNEIIKKNFNNDEILNIVDTNNLSKNNIENFINIVKQKYPNVTGKKFASGHTTLTHPYNLSVTNLNFNPTIVIIVTSHGTSNVTYFCVSTPLLYLSPRTYKDRSTDGSLKFNESGFQCTNLFDLNVSKREVPCDWIAIE